MSSLSMTIDPNAICVFFHYVDGVARPFGSGCFFMRRNLVLTAKHVFEDRNDPDAPTYLINGKVGGSLVGARPQRYWSHPEIDLALVQVELNDELHLDRPLFPSHFSFNHEKGCFAAGYDRVRSDPETKEWVVGVNRVHEFRVEQRSRRSSEEFCLEFETSWLHEGYSGGPLLGEGGGVIAVITNVFSVADSSTQGNARTHGRATSVYPIVDAFRSPFE